MKKGKTITELALEIDRQQHAKRDFMLPATKIHPFVHNDTIELGFPINDDPFTAPLNTNGHNQLGNYCNVPKKYYDLMKSKDNLPLLAHNLKWWLERSSDRRMIRTMDGTIRAFLSDTYRRLDNFDLAQHVLPMLVEAGANIESSEITENKFFIKAITHKVQGEVKKGDVVSAGVIISNSETGNGSLAVKPMILRLVCMNGAVADDFAMRKYHAGRQNEMEQIEFANDTKNADDKAFWLKVRDLVKFSLNKVTFDKIVKSMRESTERTLIEPVKSVEMVTSAFTLNDGETSGVLKHLIEGGDLSSWGLGNAVTRMAQDVDSYERSTELESVGFKVMTRSWN